MASTSDIRKLSRLEITGKAHEDMPDEVLAEISSAAGIPWCAERRNEIIVQVNALECDTVDVACMLTLADLRRIARYVNDRCSWDIASLERAFVFLQNPPGEISADFIYGRQTPEAPESWNACLIYRRCLQCGLRAERSTSLERTMRGYLRASIADLRTELVLAAEEAMTKADLFNALSSLGVRKAWRTKIYAGPSPLGEERYNQCAKIARVLQPRIGREEIAPPQTAEEAIVVAALAHDLDISASKHPLRDYHRLERGVKSRMLRARIASPWIEIDSPYLSRAFNPYLPPELYNSSALAELARQAGYRPGGSDTYSTLQADFFLPTFWVGTLPRLTNTHTIVTSDLVSDLPSTELVSYGRRHGAMHAFTFEELAQTWAFYRCFVDPRQTPTESGMEPPRFFEAHAISKLLLLAKSAHVDELARIIREIRRAKATISFALHERHLVARAEGHPGIVPLLRLLLEFAMYLRGWDGPEHPWPITSAPVDNFSLLSVRVTTANAMLAQRSKEVALQGFDLWTLPLLRYCDGSFFPTTPEESIGKRVEDVRQNKVCIRTSSNLLVATAYHYLVLVGQKPAFDMAELRSIA